MVVDVTACNTVMSDVFACCCIVRHPLVGWKQRCVRMRGEQSNLRQGADPKRGPSPRDHRHSVGSRGNRTLPRIHHRFRSEGRQKAATSPARRRLCAHPHQHTMKARMTRLRVLQCLLLLSLCLALLSREAAAQSSSSVPRAEAILPPSTASSSSPTNARPASSTPPASPSGNTTASSTPPSNSASGNSTLSASGGRVNGTNATSTSSTPKSDATKPFATNFAQQVSGGGHEEHDDDDQQRVSCVRLVLMPLVPRLPSPFSFPRPLTDPLQRVLVLQPNRPPLSPLIDLPTRTLARCYKPIHTWSSDDDRPPKLQLQQLEVVET